MRKNIKVIPGSDRDDVMESNGLLIVRVGSPARDNRANISIMKLLSRYFGKNVRIISGFKGKRKVVEIPE